MKLEKVNPVLDSVRTLFPFPVLHEKKELYCW